MNTIINLLKFYYLDLVLKFGKYEFWRCRYCKKHLSPENLYNHFFKDGKFKHDGFN